MIISASRRTDIPAFYADWLIKRLREGWCEVPNPLNYHQLSYVSLKPEDVTVLVFWSKNPKPLLEHLDEIETRGYRYYFQFTLNDYSSIFEPGLPSIHERLDTFKRLCNRLDDRRLVWRYDPIIISSETPVDYHIEKFSRIAETLKGYTQRVMVSFVDYYKKTDLRLEEIRASGCELKKNFEQTKEAFSLMKQLGEISKQNGISIFTCAEEVNYSNVGVSPGCCIDSALINKIWSLKVTVRKDPTQRTSCLCAVSKDIGINDTCLHGCTYCYATRKNETAEKRNSQHNQDSPSMWGATRPLSEQEKSSQLAPRLL